MKHHPCRICGESARVLFSATVLGKYSITYYQCQRCAAVQTESPYWLDEAYRQPIGDQDTWQIERSMYAAALVESLLPLVAPQHASVVDYGAGYGMLVRLLRNRGITAYWYDRFADNLFAKEYSWQHERADLVTAFEVAEHFVNPLEEFRQMFSIAPAVLLSTVLVPTPPPMPDQWDYYALSGGQHVTLYTLETLRYLAAQFDAHLYSNRTNIHLLSKQPLEDINAVSTLGAWQAMIHRIEQTFAPVVGQPRLDAIPHQTRQRSYSHLFGIAIFHGIGDILNATIIARQLKADHPNAHLVWLTAEQYSFVLKNNPDIDELVTLPGDPRALDGQIDQLRAARPWDGFFVPAPYMAYDKLPGGDLTELLLATYDGKLTVPLRSVMELTPEEVAQARAWWAQLPADRPRILVETEFFSSQSPWDVSYARDMIAALRPLQPVFVFTAKHRPPYLDELAADYPDILWCDLPFRLNAELYNCCDAFIGVSSAISCLSNSTWCREDIPHIEVVSGPHWSTWHFRHHTRRRIAFDRTKFGQALEWLAQLLSSGSAATTTQSEETLLDLYTHRIEGKYHWLSPALLPHSATGIGQQDAMRTIARVLGGLEPFYLCYGGIGDFLLALSSALDGEDPITVVTYPNSTAAAQAFFDALPQVRTVYILPRHPNPMEQYIAGMYLRTVTHRLPNCRGRGVTPPAREDDFWQPGLDIVRTCGVSLYPRWVKRYKTTQLEKPQIVIAPMGSTCGMFRSKRNIIAPQYWEPLLSVFREHGLRPIIIGTPDEACAYPADQWARDERSYSFEQQFQIIASADLVIAADSWHKTFAAMAGIPTIVFEPLRNHDLAFWRDSSNAAFIEPWSNIRLVRSWDEALHAITEALAKWTTTTLPRRKVPTPRPIEYHRRTNPNHPLTSLHPIFWERPYADAERVLLRLPDAVGDTLMMTAVTAALRQTYPHLQLTVAGGVFTADIFRNNPDVGRCVVTNSCDDLREEATADIIVDYRFLIDQLPEYYGILPMMDILANVAGVHLPSKRIQYHISENEHQWAHELLPDERAVLAVHLDTAKDPFRTYPHTRELLAALLQSADDTTLLWLGSAPAPIQSERIVDCARSNYSLRQQIALVARATAAVTIDSAFYHVAHNMWQKPTLLLAGPTSEYLIGDYTAAPLYTLRNSTCNTCYWHPHRCKRTCLASLPASMVASAVTQLLQRVRGGTARPLPPPNRSILRCSWDHLQRHYFAACMQHRAHGGLVTVSITPGDPLPRYAHQWNGITIGEQTQQTVVSLHAIFQP